MTTHLILDYSKIQIKDFTLIKVKFLFKKYEYFLIYDDDFLKLAKILQ